MNGIDTSVLIAAMPERPAHDLLAALGPVLACWGEEHGQLIVYATEQQAVHIRALLPLASSHRLIPLLAIAGASPKETPTHHYVVWTDAEPGWEQELAQWYGEEHLPGLASVPGAVRARRFEQQDEGPLSYACYDLTSAEVLGSPPWLKVRATDWSSRVRPHFTNPRRWMSEILRTPEGIVA